MLAPIVLFRAFFFPGQKLTAAFSLLVIANGFWIGFEAMSLSGSRRTTLVSVPPSTWLEGWLDFAGNTWAGLAPHFWPVSMFFAATLSLTVVLFLDVLAKPLGQVARAAVVLFLVGVLYGLFAGTRDWVAGNGYADRYAIPSVILLQSGLAGFAALPISGCLHRLKLKPIFLLAPALLFASVYSYGLPSLSSVRSDLDVKFGGRTPDILAARCTHVAGDYWVVWPAVYHANLVRYERGESGVIWGVSYRSTPTLDSIRKVPLDKLRIAVPIDDGEAQQYFDRYQFPPLVTLETRSTIFVLVPEKIEK